MKNLKFNIPSSILIIGLIMTFGPAVCPAGEGQGPMPGSSYDYHWPVLHLVAGVSMTPDYPLLNFPPGGQRYYSIWPSLPPGLSLNQSTGVISGTPASRSVLGPYTVSLSVGGQKISTTLQISVDHLRAVPTHLIFANYMVCYDKEGQTVDGYKKEIMEARAAGLDGWALDMGGYDKYAYYAQRTTLIFQALQELQLKDFFVFFMVEPSLTAFSAASVVKLVKQYADTPNYLTYEGKPFLSDWSAQNLGTNFWVDQIINPLKKDGYTVYFVPSFGAPDNASTSLPAYSKIIQGFTNSWWDQALDGYYYFATAGLPYASNNTFYQQPEPSPTSLKYSYSYTSLIASGENLALYLHGHGKSFMGGISLSYWGRVQTTAGRRYFEYQGGEGTDTQWRSLILKQKPDWVMVVTWNDFNESYTCPVNAPIPNAGEPQSFFYTHEDYWKFSKPYFDWYHTGVRPKIKEDQVYYFYRTQPKDALVPDDPQGPVSDQYGNVEDVIYLTSMLTAPADLTVTTGTQKITEHLKAGLQFTRVPFQPGMQSFVLARDGHIVLSDVSTQPIQQMPPINDFFYVIGHLKKQY